ncbi:dynein regulatory complex protein 10 [Histomonas meleagridis]|uniref:dynein regulatory complex protein 10 n=1 Tax=Histomonas meleagridis TaxID=135588 RepID=UPI00355A3230|nr:dynein regulatory complex protein 10 [Histomonas meleagridis]KAH0806595.1 dynein regulatory complex protein 10 [Histomonas meleagridis]
MKTNETPNRNTVSSIEARRILAVLEDCKSRIEYALLLPTLNDFLEGREDLDEELQVAHAEFLTRQHDISSMINADGQAKQDRQLELEDETILYKDSARDLIRVMKKHSDFFAPLLQQQTDNNNSTKLISIMQDLNDMMNLTFSTPVESDQKQKRMIQEIQQRKKTSRDYINQLNTRLLSLTQEMEKKVHSKEDTLDEIKHQIQQARANEAAIQQEDVNPEEVQTQEESLKQQLAETKMELSSAQKANSDEEGKQRRTLRKEEEAIQELITKYDEEMTDLTTKILKAREDAEEKERELKELKEEYEEIEKRRAPLRHEEQGYVVKTNNANRTNQELIASTLILQAEIRKFLETAPKPTRKRTKSRKTGRRTATNR